MKCTIKENPVKTILAGLSLFIYLLAFPAAGHAQETVRLQLKWHHQFQFAGYYAALEKGYYRDAGLNVKILEGGPNISVAEAVRAGRAEFGVGTSSALLSRARGGNIVVLAAVFQHSPAVLLVTRQSGINSVKAMQNQRLMDAPDCEDIVAMLKSAGVDYARIPRVKHEGDPRDLLTGKADAMLAYSGNQAFALEQRGVSYKEFTPRAFGIDFYGDNLITSNQEIAQHPERAEAFRAASLKGWKYAFAHKAEICDLIFRRYSQAKSRQALMYEANQDEVLTQPDLVELGYQNPARWQAIAETYKSLGMLETASVPDGLIYKHETHAVPRWLLPLLLAVLALSLAGFVTNIRIRKLNHRLELEIDERREAEIAITTARDETEAMHGQLVGMSEALPLAMFQLEIRPDGTPHYTFLSHRAEELLGVPHAELLANPAERWRNVHPDDAELVASIRLDNRKKLLAPEEEKHLEFTARVLNGQTCRWLLTSAHAAPPLPDGTVVWNGFYQDVTGQKQHTDELSQANEALRESEARLSKTTENAPCLIFQFMLRPDGSAYFPYASAFTKTYFGIAPEDVREDASPILNLFHPDDVPGYQAAVEKAVANHDVFKHEWRFLFPDSRITWAQAISRPEFFDNGDILWSGILMDITERKQAEEALRHSQTQLQGIIDNSPAIIFMKDLEGRYILGNRQWEQFTGLKLEDAIGHTDFELFPFESALEWTGHDRAVLASGVAAIENEAIERDGKISYLLSSKFPFLDEKGEPFALCGMTLDVTETKRAEEALREREAEFRTLVDNIPGVVYRCEAGGDWKMYFVSDEMERLTGYPASDFMGEGKRSFSDVIHPDDRETRRTALLASVEEERPYELEYRMIHRDGSLRWVSCMGQAIRDEQGKPIFFIGTLFDITQRKEAEQALRESQLRIDLALNAAEITFANYEVRDQNYTIRGHVAKLLSSSEEINLPAEEWNQLIVPEDRERVITQRNQSILNPNENDWRMEYRITAPQGAIHWLEIRGKILRDDVGQPERVTAIVLDTTKRKQFEEELRLAKLAADESNKAKSDFLANMSHEIRTPMNAVIGMTHLALQTELTDRQRNYLQKIDVASRNLLGIINDILDFSKIEAGKLQMEVTDFNLDEVLQNVADMFMTKAQERGIEFLLRWEPGVPSLLLGDSLRIGQVLINLTSNAFKFTERGEIEVRVEKVAETADAVTLQFSVRDTGIGLTPEQQGRLFQAFSQADSSTTRKYGGTGLGLTISKRLVELMQGRIWLESEAGIGTTFFFTTVLGKSIAGPSGGKWEVGELSGLRVLVVDDNASSREIMQGILQSFNFEAVTAPSGQQALEILQTNTDQPFDLVLLDWQMPGMDGIEVARRIRSAPQLPSIPPIIMVSAYGREELMRQATKIGISGFLIKPVNPSLLLDTIIQVFGKGGHLTTTDATAETEDEARKLRGLRVLLVEDNEINQEVALEILAGVGIIVTTADNGEQGVAAVRAAADAGQLYDAVLMDCQMPVLDGYEATRLLRQEARFADLPIIAMTANAMAGDREKCLAAGMNDHVTKPIEIRKLFSALAQLPHPPQPDNGISMGNSAHIPQPGTPQLKAPQPPVKQPAESTEIADFDLELPGVDVATGLSHMRGNRDLYRRILTKFREGQAKAVEEIRAAQQSGDGELATRLAHTLKGVSGNIGAHELLTAAADVEHSLKENPQADIEEKLSVVSARLEPLLAAIATLDSNVLPTKEDTALPAGQPVVKLELAAIEPLIQKIEPLLQRSNTKAKVAIEELKSLLSGTEYEAALSNISKAVSDYNFNEAREQWQELTTALSDGGAAPATLDYAAMQPVMEKIEALLQRSNTKARGAIGELKSLLSGTAHEAALDNISKAVGDYNFSEAREQWQDLAQSLERKLAEGNQNGE